MKDAGKFVSRRMSVRLCVGWISLLGLLLVGRPAAAQEDDLGPLPLPATSVYLDAQSLIAASPQSRETPEKLSAPQKNSQNQFQKSTSNDRILWTLPNFLTVENADSIPPMSPEEKFKVTAKGLFDPFEFVLVGFVASLGQASNSNPSYGQGMQGYAKRYATSYGDNLIENFMGSAVLPSVLHQDPRYYQLGHGGFLRRTGHALSRVLITRSDSGEKQFNYSEIGGGLTAAAISTYSYHPQSERGVGNVFSVCATQLAWDSATYMVKEFWPDLRKRSRKHKNDLAAQNSGSNSN